MRYEKQSIVYLWLGLAFTAGPLSAQDIPPVDWQPVDQTVSDLDLRAASQRYTEQGIGAYGQSGSLYRRSDIGTGWMNQGQPLSQIYQLRQPGFTAYLDRPDYLVIDRQGEMNLNVAPSADGRFLDIVPPNTVYDLVYRPPTAPLLYDPAYDMGLGNTHMNTQFDGAINAEITGEPTAQPLPELPVAHRLPPHLIRERELRAAEAREAMEQAEGESVEAQDDAEADTAER